MRRLASAVLTGLIAVAPGSLHSRPAPRLTCAEAMARVRTEADVILEIESGRPERFVRDRAQCNFSEVAELRFVPTRDNPQCPVGYRCREPSFEEWSW